MIWFQIDEAEALYTGHNLIVCGRRGDEKRRCKYPRAAVAAALLCRPRAHRCLTFKTLNGKGQHEATYFTLPEKSFDSLLVSRQCTIVAEEPIGGRLGLIPVVEVPQVQMCLERALI